MITGAVQGVGFRPFVYREAVKYGLRGWVKNTAAGVEILVSGPAEALDAFARTLRHDAPPPAHVDHVEIVEVDSPPNPAFQILPSEADGDKRARLLPDLAACPECLGEMGDPANRRYRYPFTNCTACGPRYSIMRGLPYDRERTTMAEFPQCPDCEKEFRDPANRRFHAQPNACPVCGPQLALWDRNGKEQAVGHDALLAAVEHIRAGAIVAVKGLGGFHLMVDAANDRAVHKLRERKHREKKPFAVMTPDLACARALAEVSEVERAWLCSAVAPIVLLKKKTPDPSGASDWPDRVAPDNPCLGLFLPYTPLHHLLMDELGTPAVATSGNLSDEPICTDEREALDRLGAIADYFLVHNRPIAHPVDDSVLRVVLDRPLILRAARGLAPLTLNMPEGAATLGVGPHMKCTVALGNRGRVVVSPHIGDLETEAAGPAFEGSVRMLEELYEITPDTIACDLHPNYTSTLYAEQRTRNPVRVQHHHAHVLAVMAEYGLAGPVLGVAWDGTGYGDDGTIWGGEFLQVDRHGYQRIAHLRLFPLPGGDAAAREPRRSALGILHEMGGSDHPGFSEPEVAILRKAISRNIHTVMTSSAGRLFDAVAAILGICLKSHYEGEAAMRLQAEAERANHDGTAYPHEIRGEIIDWAPVISGVIVDRDNGVSAPMIAARFHQSMVNMILEIANRHPSLPVVLAGGCFQNAWLLEQSVTALQRCGHTVFWPQQLPPNDGAISVGQVLGACWNNPSN